MKFNGQDYRSIWLADDQKTVAIIDQRFIPFQFVIESISNVKQMAVAIEDMHLRGAPLIGAAAGYGMFLAALEAKKSNNPDHFLNESKKLLWQTRPTAVNLHWALDYIDKEMKKADNIDHKIDIARETARKIADDDVMICQNIGLNGVEIIKNIARNKEGAAVQILTHCNAGALATVDQGTATSSIYEAHRLGINIHVYVDETRPRNQGKITAWELEQNNVPHTVICDNTGGYLMMNKMVDLVIVGTDRVARNGDVANKIGTYLKALAAYDNQVPFYVALPSTTFDQNLAEGADIPIEKRSEDEVLFIDGLDQDQQKPVRLFSPQARALNYGFDITPARLVTGFITEKGIFAPHELEDLFCQS